MVRIAILGTLLLATLSPLLAKAQESKFRPLFDGETLHGWYGNNPHVTARATAEQRAAALEEQQAEFKAHWTVENGELVNDGHGPYATTLEEFGDIELLVDYKTVAKADSGIYLRGTPQVQIWDTTEAGGKWDRHANLGSGGLFNNSKGAPGQLPLSLADRAFGEWNEFRILQIGSRTWVELNGQLVVDGAIMENFWDKSRATPLPARGPIHLQTHGGEIRWKNIAVREIDNDEAIRRLRGDDQQLGFTSLFNGLDLSGWTGAVDDYVVQDGTIMCSPGRGGVLFTEQKYKDFVVRLEFKLPPGGNNGLAIRYPGQGRAAYDGMCELQVLDNEAEKYADLDPRQYHGSVYGIAAAQRGYLRPAGQWNYQEVTVQGSRIRVELNGTVIVDVDVDTINDYQENRPHPGKTLRQGHFGFAGHNDPVMFRNIAIKELSSNDDDPTSDVDAADPQVIFSASFDQGVDADVAAGDKRLYTAESSDRETPRVGLHTDAVTQVDEGGIHGGALKFTRKTSEVVYYSGDHLGYRPRDWQGSLSVWLKLDPDKDLEPGYCDPIQVTERAWNDAALFIDFDQDLPRDFRLGAFADYTAWNPEDIAWDELPVAERPMVTVKRPPFSSEEWTHVCFTWSNVNASDDQDAVASLYLNGKLAGSLRRPLQFTWNPERTALMIGLNYIGLMDELQVFDRALSAEQVSQLYGSWIKQ